MVTPNNALERTANYRGATRKWLAIVVIMLGIYLLVHALMAGFGAYLLWDLDRTAPPSLVQHPTMDELRKTQDTLVTGGVVFGVFGALTLAAGIGLSRGWRWGRPLWLGTSVILMGCIFVAVFSFGTPWNRYLFEAIVVVVSWWYMAMLARGKA